MPTFDAVIPAYNPKPGWLDWAVASLLPCASFGLQRIVIVDDGSTPPVQPPALPADRSSGPVPSVELLRQSNAGPSAARNRAFDHLAASDADWAFLLDADDRAIPEGVRALLSLAVSLNAAGAVPARIHRLSAPHEETETPNPDHGERQWPGPVPPEWADRALPHPAHIFRPISLFSATGALVSKAAIRAGLRFDESLRLGEDREFFYRLAQHGPLAVSSAPAILYTEHCSTGSNLTSTSHFARRVRDHVTLLDRHANDSGIARQHFEQATRWLINACSKADADEAAWRSLLEAARRHGFTPPLKSRIRRLLRGPLRARRSTPSTAPVAEPSA
ncbi:MAG: glycosyltransferase family 2 protein [Phycisphaeraceae bacterium]|nr:glycosyltransferase family 2 protein [Phycisphaeraceae bacterium]